MFWFLLSILCSDGYLLTLLFVRFSQLAAYSGLYSADELNAWFTISELLSCEMANVEIGVAAINRHPIRFHLDKYISGYESRVETHRFLTIPAWWLLKAKICIEHVEKRSRAVMVSGEAFAQSSLCRRMHLCNFTDMLFVRSVKKVK